MPQMPAFDLNGFLPYRLAVASKRASDGMAQHYRSRGLTTAEWRVLTHLTQAEHVSVRDIETRVALPRYEVSRAAKRLQTAGHISKQPRADDKRLVDLSLTEQGRALMADLVPLAQSYQDQITALLGECLPGLTRGLDRLLEDTADTALPPQRTQRPDLPD